MLLDHAGGESRQLDCPGLQAAVQIGVLQRGAYLVTEREQELVVQSGERISRVPNQHRAMTASARKIGNTAA